MTLFRLDARPVFPDPRRAEPSGLLAIGGDLSPERLLSAYACGIFPWFEPGDPLLWWSPPERALFLPADPRLSRRTRRLLRAQAFSVTCDTDFAGVIHGCRRMERPGQDGTWITPEMEAAYLELHRLGWAHSFEARQGGRLVGGLYGLSLGAAFFGESMFRTADGASRAAFGALCATLGALGFHFLDGQMPNSNLLQLGARRLARGAYLGQLARALEQPTLRGPWSARLAWDPAWGAENPWRPGDPGTGERAGPPPFMST